MANPLPQAVIIKTYQGDEQGAIKAFQKHSAEMAQQGYYPTSQSWAPGAYGCATFLLALALCFVLIGFLIFIYMLIVKPAGVLSVTYEYRAAPAVVSEKTCPRCAETVKSAAKVCRFCGYNFEEP